MILLFFIQLILATAVYFDNVNLTIPNSTQFVSLYGPDNLHMFTYTVNSAGDFNGDGIDDIIIGAPSTTLYKGTAYLIYGSKDGISDMDLSTPLNSTKGFKIQGEATGDFLEYGADTAGDFNGDGIDDIVLGAPSKTPGGAVYVIFGSKTPITDLNLPGDLVGRGFKISGTQSTGIFGSPVAHAGDINGWTF